MAALLGLLGGGAGAGAAGAGSAAAGGAATGAATAAAGAGSSGLMSSIGSWLGTAGSQLGAGLQQGVANQFPGLMSGPSSAMANSVGGRLGQLLYTLGPGQNNALNLGGQLFGKTSKPNAEPFPMREASMSSAAPMTPFEYSFKPSTPSSSDSFSEALNTILKAIQSQKGRL